LNQYSVKKSFNNNAVLVTKEDTDYILIGRGIGFDKKRGDRIPESKMIENVFIMVDEKNRQQYENLLENVDHRLLAITEDIIRMAEEDFQEKLHADTHLGLVDHISFAVRRIREGIGVVNPFLVETRMMYRQEYAVAAKAVRLIRDRLGIEIPESETGFIALHLHGGRLSGRKGASMKYVKALSQVIPYIEDKLGISLEEDSFDSVRLMSHLRAMLERCSRKETIDNVLLDRMKKDFAFEYKISENIGLILDKNIGIVVPENEIGYIALHLYKLRSSRKGV
jgi:transcriptional antiterminator